MNEKFPEPDLYEAEAANKRSLVVFYEQNPNVPRPEWYTCVYFPGRVEPWEKI